VRRREFIAGLGSTAAWPVVARAQQPAMPVVGILNSSAPIIPQQLSSLRDGLKQIGYVEGRNVAFEIRAAERYDQLPNLAVELARRQVTAIYAGALPAALAAKAATATIPVVFYVGGDPLEDGLVTSVSRPTGNLTGVTFFSSTLVSKRLELLHELVPRAGIIAVLLNPNNPNMNPRLKQIRDAALVLGVQLFLVYAKNDDDLAAAFSAAIQQRAVALLMNDDQFFGSRTEQVVALAARHSLPTIYSASRYVAAGGLIGYSSATSDMLRQVGIYIGRILKGEKPADPPVVQPTKFELAINLKTAKALGLAIPETLLATADEVIQ
jgi:putative tryptophan/tyrosine transport system substrate-binding protein